MNNRIRFCLFALLGTASLAQADTAIAPAYVTAALADKARPTADTQRDHERKPAELIQFAGIKPGDTVADFIPGGGYFTRIFSKVVGPQGHVRGIVPESIEKAKPKALDGIKALAAEPGYANTSVEIRPYDDIGADASLDVVWTSQNYHDVYGAVSVFAVSGSSGPEQTAKLDAAVFKALKPGGEYIVIDHAAKPGSTEKDANALHRIDPDVVIAQAKTAGFVLEARSSLLANPQDDHAATVFAPEIKGNTDKFVLKFRKPER